MGRPRIEYTWGQEIGENGIIFLKELEGRRLPSGVIERYVLAKCPVCGKEFETSLRRVVRKQTSQKKPVKQCQECSQKENNIRIANEGRKAIKNLKGQRFGKLIVLEITDKRINKNVVWKCQCDCGNIVEINALDLQRGHTKSCGCLKSSGEYLIGQILQKVNINYQTQKIFQKCLNPEHTNYLRFDFYLPDYNCCIEYDGEQHFKSVKHFGGEEKFQRQQQLDNIKNQYCKKNNIRLIRIPYTDYNKLNSEYLLNLL